MPRPLVDQHTILHPGEAVPTEADAPTYTRTDLEVSEGTAQHLRDKSAPANTSRNYASQRGKFAEWCEEMGRVARPRTTATYVERVAGLIAREMTQNTIRTYMLGVRTWMPEDRRPGTTEERGICADYRKEWGKRNRVRKAPAITEPMLHAMVDTCDLHLPAGLRDRCTLLVGRGALNRRIELADLNIADIEVEDGGVDLWIADAGADPTHQGRWKPGSATVKREYLDRAQSRAQNPRRQVRANRRSAEPHAQ
ncbi:hypothetical protein [Streptomyces sp. NBC_01244]|uniref:hypothetical protein n=1 Tax=Streptomyces sp. NBC_01244 TaxID=2903797 RepID=UPI002E0F4BA3|nr:hypothetical protein OG247_41400 [Streptomyces sp. NBC_01244]